MKKFLRLSLFAISAIFIGLTACNDDDHPEGMGQAEFSIAIPDEVAGSLKMETDVHAAIVTIEDESGKMVYNAEELSIYNFGSNYITEPLSLMSGSYKLTGFLIIDSDQNVIYAAPLESSKKAYLVENPLPIGFNVNFDDVTKVVPEVLSTFESLPDEFGYNTFSFNMVETFDFLVTVFKYNESIANFELTNANIVVTSSSNSVYSGSLDAVTNKITVNDNYDNYDILITKDGYTSYSGTFSNDSLKKHLSTPLTVVLEEGSNLIAYYPFNGNANDESFNSYNGTVYGATLTTDKDGNANSAYHFDGDDYIEVPNFGDIVPTQEITVSMWIRTEQSRAQCQLMLCPNTDRFGISVHYYHDGQNTNFWDFGWLGEGGNPPGRTYYRPEVHDTEWHHYVFVSSISQSKQAIYKDGALQISESDPRTLQNAAGKTLKIGSNDGFGYHIGDIDEVKVFNRALSTAEVSQLYNE